ncbi:DNA methylase N-4/N-6 domain protein [Roseiflexus castenholzii DSM 13941]|uniref:DNA methylase N-4/N-6 domain protein n=2 Tax=Roseiflexus castenholzii TaxID=120962 RepID=A7NM43_ROSCS|nr:DNA methylase N-4/N-6 domain protein [Roseiflexus castenholzii DSM 13941]
MERAILGERSQAMDGIPIVHLSPPAGRAWLTWNGKRLPTPLSVPPAVEIERCGVGDNLLLHGENLAALAWLLANGYRRRINLIYIDPPFGSGIDRARRVRLRGPGPARLIPAAEVEYCDTWDDDAYLQFMYERLIALRDLLADDGCIYLHCDFRKAHHLRCLMDEVFGAERMLNEIIWFYPRGGDGERQFNRKHDTILLYARGDRWTFNYDAVLIPYTRRQIARFRQEDERGRYYWNVNPRGERVKTYLRKPGIGAYDVWTIPIDAALVRDLGYPTAKPLALLERIIRASSRPGDLVLDCFAGSGTTAVAAQHLERRWIACDANPGAIQVTARRLRQAILERAPLSVGFSTWRIGDAVPAPQGEAGIRVLHRNEQVTVVVEAYSSSALATLSGDPSEWRRIVDEILIDPMYDGTVFRPVIIDAPLRRSALVRGAYTMAREAISASLALKIVDITGGEAFTIVSI